METKIVKPRHELLKKYVEYFLFLDKSDTQLVNYTTFPNSNLCLAIYKQNEVSYRNEEKTNCCSIKEGTKFFSSRIYGFHTMPFTVDLRSELDQVCIIFHPAALRAFSNESLFELQRSDMVFDELLKTQDSFVLERLFEETDVLERARILEAVLVSKLRYSIPDKVLQALDYIGLGAGSSQEVGVEMLCSKLKISDTTLFRLFKTHLGQNPKQFIKTVRFRNALPHVLDHSRSLTEIGFQGHYYDQAHFIKDFRAFAGLSPKKLQQQVSMKQDKLAWIYKETQAE